MPQALSSFLAFFINIIFECYIVVVLLRFLLQLFGTDYYNLISQWVLRLTSWTVTLLQKLIPNYHQISFAALIVAILLASAKIVILLELNNQFFPYIPGTLLWASADLLYYTVHIFIYAIFGQIILSWIRPAGAYALLQILDRLTSPILRPIQRILPNFGGLDLSPIPALILLKLITAYAILPLQTLGAQLAFSG
jgi:YggT family protein